MLTQEELERQGFVGFKALRSLPRGCPKVPGSAGVYAVLRASTTPPEFVEESVGGHFKGKDPTVPRHLLEGAWVDDVDVLYYGRSGNLRRRLDEFARYGRGEPVGHQGGRYLWQLADPDSLIVAWVEDPDPAGREASLVGDFLAETGRLPFANLNRPRSSRQ